MSALKKILSLVMISLATLFLSVGYAALSDELGIHGSASVVPPPQGIFIIDVDEISTSGGVSSVNAHYISPTNVDSTVRVTGEGSITYKITVENNTASTYWYREIAFMGNADGYQNNLINQAGGISIVTKDKLDDSNASFNSEDWVPPHSKREFYVTYSYGRNVAGVFRTLINYSFGARLVSYGDEFLEILNTPERYAALAGVFDATYRENGSTVLANVGADADFFSSLFESPLTLNGEAVTVMIQRANVDGKSTGDSYSPSGLTGCEYTLYITTDDTTSGKPVVHAVTYTTDGNGGWKQIGELYEGTTSLSNYIDSEGNSYSSIDASSWIATQKTYTVFSYGGRVVKYTVNNRYGNYYQQQDTLSEIVSIEDIEMYNQLDDHPIFKDTYKILREHQGSDSTEIVMLRDAYNEALKYFNMYNNGQEFKVIRNKYSRAEIIASLEALAAAMNYYQQTHDTGHN